MEYLVIPLVVTSTSLVAVAVTGAALSGLMYLMQHALHPAPSKT